jgi:hypothetical protein
MSTRVRVAAPLGFLTVAPLGPWSDFKNVPYVGATGNFPSVFFPLGSDGAEGRDEFLRLLYGGQASLEVAIFATAISITFGVIFGAAAGYFGGWIDMIISRVTELTMAFRDPSSSPCRPSRRPQLNKITFGFLPKSPSRSPWCSRSSGGSISSVARAGASSER